MFPPLTGVEFVDQQQQQRIQVNHHACETCETGRDRVGRARGSGLKAKQGIVFSIATEWSKHLEVSLVMRGFYSTHSQGCQLSYKRVYDVSHKGLRMPQQCIICSTLLSGSALPLTCGPGDGQRCQALCSWSLQVLHALQVERVQHKILRSL